MVSAQQPLVSVCVLSYNHEKFIAETLDSVMQQKTNFGFEVLIFDDGSADGTAEILKRFENEAGGSVRVFLSDNNKGNYLNGLRLKDNVKGKYVAFLDGDDRWLYNEKLQRQVDYLEANPAVAGVFHDAAIEHISGDAESVNKSWRFEGFKTYSQFYRYYPQYTPADGLKRKIIPHSALMVQTALFLNAVKNYPKLPLSGSWVLQQLIIKNSTFHYINETWSVYREHATSLTKSNNSIEFNQNNINALKYFVGESPAFSGIRMVLYENIAEEYKFIMYTPWFNRLPLMQRLGCLFAFFWYQSLYVLNELGYQYIKLWRTKSTAKNKA